MMILNLNMNRRHRKIWIAKHKRGVELFWTIIVILLLLFVLGIVGRMEYETCLKGIC